MAREPEEARRILKTFARWLELREQTGYPFPSSLREFVLEAEHSLAGGLLHRLLIEDKEPLDHTPPLAFSRPWYKLIETGKAAVESEFVFDFDNPANNTIVICQHQWHVLRREGDAYVVDWRPGKTGKSHWGLWKLSPVVDGWLLERMG